MDGEANVVLAHKFFDARQCRWRGIARHNHANACALGIFEFGADVVVIVLRKVNRSDRVKLDARGGIVGQSLCF